MTDELKISNQNQPQEVPKLEDYPLYMDYAIACREAGVQPEPNPKKKSNHPVSESTAVSHQSSSVQHPDNHPVQSSGPSRTLGFDPRVVEPFDGFTAEQIKTVAVYHWDWLPLFSKDKTSWWAENTKGLEFFKRNFHKMAEAFPAGKLTLEAMEYAIKKALEPPMEWDFDPHCPKGCNKGFLRKLENRLPKIIAQCECRHLVPVGKATWRDKV
jgi:hypothetical protein